MRNLNAAAYLAKNKLHSNGVWFITLDIYVPLLDETIYLVANTGNITWNGNEYIAFDFEFKDISESSKGELPEVVLRVSNISRALETYLEQGEGGIGSSVVLRVLHEDNLLLTTPEVELDFKVIGAEADAEWVTFRLGMENFARKRYPAAKLAKNMCRYKKFGGSRCGFPIGHIGGNDSNTVVLYHFDQIETLTKWVYLVKDSAQNDIDAHASIGLVNFTEQTGYRQFWGNSATFLGAGVIEMRDVGGAINTSIGTGPFTIDFQVLPYDLLPSTESYFFFNGVMYTYGSFIAMSKTTLRFRIVNGANSINLQATFSTLSNDWHHVAIIKGWGGNSDMFAITIDGALVASQTVSGVVWTGGAYPRIGNQDFPEFYGSINEFRISNIARWTTAFTPPSRPYSFDLYDGNGCDRSYARCRELWTQIGLPKNLGRYGGAIGIGGDGLII